MEMTFSFSAKTIMKSSILILSENDGSLVTRSAASWLLGSVMVDEYTNVFIDVLLLDLIWYRRPEALYMNSKVD